MLILATWVREINMRLMLGVAALAANVIAVPAAITWIRAFPPIKPLLGFRVKSNRSAPIRWATKSRYGPKHSRASTPT